MVTRSEVRRDLAQSCPVQPTPACPQRASLCRVLQPERKAVHFTECTYLSVMGNQSDVCPEMQTDGFTDARGFSQPYTRPSACDCQPTLLWLPKGTMWQRTRAKTTRQHTLQKLNSTSIVTLATSQEIPCELCSRSSETWLASSCIYSEWRNALSV